MATNPMQRKANSYLLIGVLVTLLITGSIIAILAMQLLKINKQTQAQKAKEKSVYVVSREISSGSTVDVGNLKKISVTGDAVPSDYLTNTGDITEKTIAKIDLKVGTIITTNMIKESDEETSDDLRLQEYNTLSLPSQIKTGDYIDIRLRMPDGTDYIVVSKKQVEIPTIGETESSNTIRIKVAEHEIMLMSNAIIEAYYASGSLLYATTYVEPGMQGEVKTTYLPSDKVIQVIDSDPNILTVAKTALYTRYNTYAGVVRNIIGTNMATYGGDKGTDNVVSGVEEEITRAQEQRQLYLESLGGY